MTLGTSLVFEPLEDKKAVPVSNQQPLPVRVAGEEQTQFGEVKVANRTPIIELNAIYGISELRDITNVTQTGSVTAVTSEILLSTGTTASSAAEIFSAERGRYIPGYGGEFGVGVRIPTPPDGNKYAEWGAVDPTINDGYVFGYDADGLYIRIYKGGSATTVRQSAWNIDRLDGTGRSGVELDLADGQVCQVEYTYYGYGEIRFGILAVVDQAQRFVACHSARVRGGTSTNKPNLPIYVGAYNGADAEDFDVYVGGRQYSIIGDYNPRFRTIGQENFGVSVDTTVTPLVTMKNKTGFEDRSVKLDYIFANVSSNDVVLEVYINGSLTGASYGTPTNAKAAETGIEVDTSATDITGGVLIYTQPAIAGQGTNTRNIASQTAFDVPENQPITFAARAISGTATVDAFMRLIEEW